MLSETMLVLAIDSNQSKATVTYCLRNARPSTCESFNEYGPEIQIARNCCDVDKDGVKVRSRIGLERPWVRGMRPTNAIGFTPLGKPVGDGHDAMS
jgi:hypothetical protein